MLTTDVHYAFAWVCVEYNLAFVEADNGCWETTMVDGDSHCPVYCLVDVNRLEFRTPLSASCVPHGDGPNPSLNTAPRGSSSFAQIDGNGCIWLRSITAFSTDVMGRQEIAEVFYTHVATVIEYRDLLMS